MFNERAALHRLNHLFCYAHNKPIESVTACIVYGTVCAVLLYKRKKHQNHPGLVYHPKGNKEYYHKFEIGRKEGASPTERLIPVDSALLNLDKLTIHSLLHCRSPPIVAIVSNLTTDEKGGYQLVAENAGQSPEVLMSNYNEALDSEKRALSRMVEGSFYLDLEPESVEESSTDVSSLLDRIQQNPELRRQVVERLLMGALGAERSA